MLREYIPRMLDDAFKLTIDVLFPSGPKQLKSNSALGLVSQIPTSSSFIDAINITIPTSV